MVRLKIIMAVIGGVILLLPPFALAQTMDSRPWDEAVVCPRCKTDLVVYILYGEPKLDEELKRALANHKVELAGCLITPDSKRWECRRCKYSWGNVGQAAGTLPRKKSFNP